MQHYYFLMSADKELNIKTLNDVAVEYFELGLQYAAYQIWDELYHEIQCSTDGFEQLLPVISCNMGNMLRKTGYYEEAYRVLTQGLKRCFGTGSIYALPELLTQLSILRMKSGNTQEAHSMYSLGKNIFLWSRQIDIGQSIEEVMDRDFLLYSETSK